MPYITMFYNECDLSLLSVSCFLLISRWFLLAKRPDNSVWNEQILWKADGGGKKRTAILSQL